MTSPRPTGLAALLLVCACGTVDPAAPDAGNDDDDADAMAAAADTLEPPPTCSATAAFDPPVPLAGLAQDGIHEAIIRVSADELTAYVSGIFDDDSGWSIAVAVRASVDDRFGPPTLLPLNSDVEDWDPTISADGRTFVFGSTRFDTPSDDLFLATRATTAAEFGAPSLIATLSSPAARDGQPFLTPGGEEIWFVSNRAGGLGGNDIYRAAWNGVSFGAPEHVPELSSPVDDWLPTLSADRLTVYISSTREGAQAHDIYVAHRSTTAQPFPTPTLVPEFVTVGSEHPGQLSADGCRFYFSSSGAGTHDAYVAIRHPE